MDFKSKSQRMKYFHVLVMVEYKEKNPNNGQEQILTFPSTLIQAAPINGMRLKELSNVTTQAQLRFLEEYKTRFAERLPEGVTDIQDYLPEIVNVRIMNISLLGEFTDNEFREGMSDKFNKSPKKPKV